MVACGQMSVQQAKNNVALDINNTSHAVANAPAVPFRNNFNPYAMTPVGRPRRGDLSLKTWQNNYDPYNMTPTGVSLEVLMQSANQLQQQFDLENNPAVRNEISFALNNLQQEINRRQAALEETPSFETMTTIDVPSQGRGYNPTKNYRASNSTMQQTVRAMANGPSIATVVKDIFTVQANVYFDWMSGPSIEFLNNGTYKNADSNSNPVAVFPKGEWTIFAQPKSSLPTLRQMKQAIAYALASPLWSSADRAYLEYLSGLTNSKINELEAIENDVDPVVNQLNNSNNNAIANVINNSNNPEQVVNEIANYKERLDQMTTSEFRQHLFERILVLINKLAPMIPESEPEFRLFDSDGPNGLFDTYMRFTTEQEFAMDAALTLKMNELGYNTLSTVEILNLAIEFAQLYGSKLNSVAKRHPRYLTDSGFLLQFAQNASTKEEYHMAVKFFELLTNGYFVVVEDPINNVSNNNGTMPNNLVPNGNSNGLPNIVANNNNNNVNVVSPGGPEYYNNNNNNVNVVSPGGPEYYNNNNNNVGNGLPNNLVPNNNAIPNNVINNNIPPNNGAPPNIPPINNQPPLRPNNGNAGNGLPPKFIVHNHWSSNGNGPISAKNMEENMRLHKGGFTHNRPPANNPRNNPPRQLTPLHQ